eukprot:CAMPEP_0168526624 /NCGR_PEP_ID=MMETSP0405-20121227/12092_1 /TAXON_ID=498012 /ORGANISM="Trichosphaerium sp, Strain Am-I-7 wt" /LENGTH=66 /DNA_ID=CAMNT_0008549529 /DNA_START=101 /DNA_END=297 /DNA_ORIENTATION=+
MTPNTKPTFTDAPLSQLSALDVITIMDERVRSILANTHSGERTVKVPLIQLLLLRITSLLVSPTLV